MGAFGGLQRVLIQPYAGVEMAWKTLPLLLQVEALIRLQFEGPSGSNARRASSLSGSAPAEAGRTFRRTRPVEPMTGWCSVQEHWGQGTETSRWPRNGTRKGFNERE